MQRGLCEHRRKYRNAKAVVQLLCAGVKRPEGKPDS
jgi:hypothetical protein